MQPPVAFYLMMKKLETIWKTYISPFLGVCGICVSIYALIDTSLDFQELKKNTDSLAVLIEEVKASTENFSSVVSSVSTRYIGEFPNNMEDLEEMLRGSKKSLKIVVDVIGYGAFSRNDLYSTYHNILRDKINSDQIEVEILVYDDSTRIEAMREQFSSIQWNNPQLQKNLPGFKNYILTREWTEKKPDKERVDNLTSIEDLFLLINELNNDLIKELENIKPGDQVVTLSKRQDVFIWLVDGNKAIFSYLNYGFNDHEVSFYTQDENFIQVLIDRFRGLKHLE
ncbi:hypothetical protein RT717_11220 [Imperialibacter roseus]|uniref:Uncharacterized protein n=1 Tax=Imperialibacter roseus TaxID=1324217 RepID=A0ABZ0IXG3_9BACT|nr:hypothetical protein [Imperialibacter roseus]WOK09207.1 hypothetical protein RT717_11220 [Imperialibacter roseus]